MPDNALPPEITDLKNQYRKPKVPLPICLSIADWQKRDIPAPDLLLGEWMSTTSRIMLAAPTGLGKTNFSLALACAVAAGRAFLHWQERRAARVLYVDGEMSRRLIKLRIEDAVRRLGETPETLFVMCRDDIEEMPPLNTEAGQEFVDRVIESLGGIDFIFFDNVMSLIPGDMKEEDGWQRTLPWIKSLTKRSIGQLWVHHTGINESRSYGTSTREWMLDCVILLERVEQPVTDIAFALKFTKSRERTPHNRADFEAVTITLAEDRWMSSAAPAKTANRSNQRRLPPGAANALAALRKAIDTAGEVPPTSNHIPGARRAVRADLFRKYCDEASVSGSEKADSRLKAFKRSVEQLQASGEIGVWDSWVWLTK